MPEVIWHQDALADIGRLYDFLAPMSPAAATRAAAVILEAGDRIAEHPGIGVPRGEFRDWRAKFGNSAYVLRYAVLQNNQVLILRIWHSRELRPS
jgi:toxin ParE1/3/4